MVVVVVVVVVDYYLFHNQDLIADCLTDPIQLPLLLLLLVEMFAFTSSAQCLIVGCLTIQGPMQRRGRASCNNPILAVTYRSFPDQFWDINVHLFPQHLLNSIKYQMFQS